MIADGALYRLLTWLSPGYPVGAFSYSHGLEYAVETGDVAHADDLADWIAAALLDGSGRVDGVLFRESHAAALGRDWDRLNEAARLGRAFQATMELALESRAQGEAFLKCTRSAWPTEALDRLDDEATYPVAVAAACAGHGIPVETALRAWFHAFAANLVSAGMRLIPLGQTDGQRALAALAGTVAEAASRIVPMTDIGTAAPLLDLASMRHETQYTRLFRS